MSSEELMSTREKIIEAAGIISAYSEGMEKVADYVEELGENMASACSELDRAGKDDSLRETAESLGGMIEKLKGLKSALANFSDRGSLVRQRIEEATKMMALIRDIDSRVAKLCKKLGKLRQEEIPALLDTAKGLEEAAARAMDDMEGLSQLQRQEEKLREEIQSRVEKLDRLARENDHLQSQFVDRLMSIEASDYEKSVRQRLMEASCQENHETGQEEAETIGSPAKGSQCVNEGDCIVFGRMGDLHLVWQVLEKDADRLLLLSRYGLECKPFHDAQRSLWKASALRTYLNSKFISRCFTRQEQELIAATYVSNRQETRKEAMDGNSTEEKVFLLSVKEAERYLRGTAEIKCRAIADGHVANHFCDWWLRTSPEDISKAAYVNKDGIINARGKKLVETNTHIRPAIWLKLTEGMELNVLDGKGNCIYD
ncbi:MAG: hypothetical protein J6N51_11805 [Selenomonas sp.]|nr:hypothetical protein [Selenomonas sp.]